MSQFDMIITYIKGEDNTVADALSRLKHDPSSTEEIPNYKIWCSCVNAVLTLSADSKLLNELKKGYKSDNFCKKLHECGKSFQSVREVNGLWYIGECLIMPRTGSIREDLFRLAHNTLGHFRSQKSYTTLRNSYYWPNMRKDLEDSYIPGCVACQRNKAPMTKPKGPLHLLPVPDERGERVSMDFIGPLPLDCGFDCILSMTDALGSDVRIIPTKMTLTANKCTELFFANWYCENRLPRAIGCDCNKLFLSQFWRTLCKLMGVNLKMSLAYHPETDGSSEPTNKTINQCICFHVDRNQKRWVRALPLIRFQIMNTVNASTGYSGFELRMGCSPKMITTWNPTEVVDSNPDLKDAVSKVSEVLQRLKDNVEEAKDNLLALKFSQAFYANMARGEEEVFEIGEKVMLNTLNRQREYKNGKKGRVAKFMPRFDGLYTIMNIRPKVSTYTLDLPNQPHVFPTFHASQIRRHTSNDDVLFPR
jgi:hypothetical protein